MLQIQGKSILGRVRASFEPPKVRVNGNQVYLDVFSFGKNRPVNDTEGVG